jgi:hypothetical protein
LENDIGYFLFTPIYPVCVAASSIQEKGAVMRGPVLPNSKGYDSEDKIKSELAL